MSRPGGTGSDVTDKVTVERRDASRILAINRGAQLRRRRNGGRPGRGDRADPRAKADGSALR
jgi:hypothetical protein